MKLLFTISQLALISTAAFAQNGEPSPANFRSRLEAKGLSFGMSYLSEVFANPKGGHYLGSASASLQLDLAALGLGRGQVFVNGQQLHGRGVNDRLAGAIQAPSNLEGETFGKLVEAWYADSYLGGKLRLKAGRQYADSDFGAVEGAADFLNSGYGVIPTAPMPTYPDPELGVNAWVAPSRRVSAGAGVYRGGSLSGNGLFAVLESRIEATARTAIRVGGWRQAANHGLYTAAEHRIGEGDRVVDIFARWGWAPEGRNDLAVYAGAGFVCRGVGAGATSVQPSAGRREIVYEIFYKRRVSDGVFVQPDLQWLRNAGGTGRGTLLAGARVGFEL